MEEGKAPTPRPRPASEKTEAGAPRSSYGSNRYKHIVIEPEVFEQLAILKYRYGFRSYSELLRYLLDVEARSRTVSELEAKVEATVREFCSSRPGARFYLTMLIKAGLVKDSTLRDYIMRNNREVACPE